MYNTKNFRIKLLLLLGIIGVVLIFIINSGVHHPPPRILSEKLGESFEPDYNGSSEFLVGDLDAQALRSSLQINNKQNVLVLEKLATTTDKLNQVTEQDFVRAFNEILSMHDFHIRVDASTYKSIMSKPTQGLLVRAQTPDAKLSNLEYLRLNRELLQAIYPYETRKTHYNQYVN